jgi:hypothetical protein
MDNRLLDYKYRAIFKYKSNGKKFIDGYDVKIKKNWGKKMRDIL